MFPVMVQMQELGRSTRVWLGSSDSTLAHSLSCTYLSKTQGWESGVSGQRHHPPRRGIGVWSARENAPARVGRAVSTLRVAMYNVVGALWCSAWCNASGGGCCESEIAQCQRGRAPTFATDPRERRILLVRRMGF